MTQKEMVVRQMGAPPSGPPRLPEQSHALLAAARECGNPHPDVGRQPIAVRVQAEAVGVLAVLDDLCQPPLGVQIRAWMLPVLAAVANPPTQGDFSLRLGPIALVLWDIPAVVLTMQTQREALRLWRFFPAAADVYALLAPHARELQALRRAMRLVITARPAPAEREALSAEQRAQISEDFLAKWRREVCGDHGPVRRV